MSDRLLKESDVIEAFKGRESLIHDAYTAVAIIRSVPSADRPQGEWIDDGLDGIGIMGVEYRWHKCSQCGFRISKSPSAYYPNFCEACGARMKGADDE